jgi:hypothetical protein
VLTTEDTPCGLTNKQTLCILWEDENFVPYVKKVLLRPFLVPDSMRQHCRLNRDVCLIDVQSMRHELFAVDESAEVSLAA